MEEEKQGIETEGKQRTSGIHDPSGAMQMVKKWRAEESKKRKDIGESEEKNEIKLERDCGPDK